MRVRSAGIFRIAVRLRRQISPPSESMCEGANLAVAQQPRDLGNWKVHFSEVAFGKRLTQRLQHARKDGPLGGECTCQRSAAHAEAAGNLRRVGLAVRKQLRD